MVMAKTPCENQRFRNKEGRCCDFCDAGRSTLPKEQQLWAAASDFVSQLSSFQPLDYIAALPLSPGKYVKEECTEKKPTQCAPCENGLYAATKNHMTSCHHCRVCSLSELGNTVLELLRKHMDTQHTHAVNQSIFSFTCNSFMFVCCCCF